MRRRTRARLALPLIALIYGLMVVVERFLEGPHYQETLK